MKIKRLLCCLLIPLFLAGLASCKLLEKECVPTQTEVAQSDITSNPVFKIAHKYAGFSDMEDYAEQEDIFGRISGEFNYTEDHASSKGWYIYKNNYIYWYNDTPGEDGYLDRDGNDVDMDSLFETTVP